MMHWLLKQNVDVSLPDSLNQTALFYASRDGKSSLVDLLYERGCDPNFIDWNGQTSIFYAAREGHTEVCKKLA